MALWSIEAMAAAGAREIVVVCADGFMDQARSATAHLPGVRICAGGSTRARSVMAGLHALEGPPDEPVLVHDAARPLVSSAVVHRVLAALQDADGAIAALPVADTLKVAAAGDAPECLATQPRDGLWRAQTPQAFRRAALLGAYHAWNAPQEPTDEAAVMEAAGARVRLVQGDPALLKITYPEDFAMAELMAGQARVMRIGQGVDAHRWGPGDHVWLCGVRIDHDQTLIGHSDADAGLHALTDAILGALGEGDIGEHFPPSDPQWRGAASDQFLRHAADLVAARGGRIINVDVTLICERPKVRPHREAMRTRLAEILGIAEDRVSVKATTTEKMGFTGREEGLLAQAIALIETPA